MKVHQYLAIFSIQGDATRGRRYTLPLDIVTGGTAKETSSRIMERIVDRFNAMRDRGVVITVNDLIIHNICLLR